MIAENVIELFYETTNEAIPDDWQTVKLGDVCDRVGSSYEPNKNGSTPYVGLEHITPGRPFVSVHGLESEVLSTKTTFKNGQILYGKLRPYLDKAGIALFDGVCSTDVLVFNSNNRSINDFIVYLLHHQPFIDYAKSTTTGVQHPRTSWNSLKHFEFALPPPHEQRAIARVLSTVQAAITKQNELIQTTRTLKKALMHKLFTETEGWQQRRLGDIATVSSGGTPNRDIKEFWVNGTIPWVKTGEINYNLITDTEEKITEVGLKGSSAKVLPAGTLLMAMYGQGVTRGRVAMLSINATLNQACAAITPKKDAHVLPKFLYYLFEHNYEYVRNFGHGANQKNLSGTIIKMFEIAYPSTEQEQQQIIDSLGVLDQKIIHHKDRKQILQALFRTLLHELMTGQRRVAV